jgi:hypothetical protein
VILRLLALVVIAWLLGFAAFMLSLGKPLEGRKTDAIVVLTGGPKRIDRGLEVLRAGDAQRMLVSGVDPDVRPGEFAAEYKIDRKLMRCCVDLGWQAVDTRSNAEETAEWVREHKYKTVRLVTSDWHMPRARMELAHTLQGVEVVGDPVRSSRASRCCFANITNIWCAGSRCCSARTDEPASYDPVLDRLLWPVGGAGRPCAAGRAARRRFAQDLCDGLGRDDDLVGPLDPRDPGADRRHDSQGSGAVRRQA